MRLLLDQMFDRDVAAVLISMGHDVVQAADRHLATADDSEILACALAEDRVLITLDEHFGDWVVLPLFREILPFMTRAHPPWPI